tara:strand:+ start:173 stop:376 length:204 start_codon:yes stop_codon:yes gene_type:complete
MESKSLFLSKTVWVNAIVAAVGIVSSFGLVPSVGVWVASHADVIMSGLGVVGIILRAVTKDKIILGA